MVHPNTTYTVLKYPEFDLPDIHQVRVLKIYDNTKLGRIVHYRYNWPLWITEEALESDFEQWIAEEVN